MALIDVDPAHLSTAMAVAVQADQKIVVGGYIFNYGAKKCSMVRYNSNGTIDNTFGSSGVVLTQAGNGCFINALAVQADQKIVAAGYAFDPDIMFMVARYNTDGSLDTTGFNSASLTHKGVATTAIGIGTTDDEATSVAIQSDGKIVAAGFSTSSGTKLFAAVRYNTDGTLDTDFSGDGKFFYGLGTGDSQANGMAIQPDQKIVLAGQAVSGGYQVFAAMRLTTAGLLDSSFSGDGSVTTAVVSSADNYGQAVAVQADGRIVVAGSANNGSHNDFAVVRYTTGGNLDTTFNTSGKVTTPVGSEYSNAYAVVVQPGDQRIVAGGSAYTGSPARSGFALVRYSINGDLDPTFGTSGKLVTLVGADTSALAGDAVRGIALQSDGKIVTAGSHSITGEVEFAVLRYWP
jgi:uncharacterized delta-60 repeat protein